MDLNEIWSAPIKKKDYSNWELFIIVFANCYFLTHFILWAVTEKFIVENDIPVVIEAKITGYTSSPEETDDTPFITASNQKVRQGIVANNCLPFGSLVKISGIIYEIQDRMNSRYGCYHFDIWSPTVAHAYSVTKENVLVEIIK